MRELELNSWLGRENSIYPTRRSSLRTPRDSGYQSVGMLHMQCSLVSLLQPSRTLLRSGGSQHGEFWELRYSREQQISRLLRLGHSPLYGKSDPSYRYRLR